VSRPISATSNPFLSKVLLGGGIVLGIRVVASAISYVSIVALARWMGAHEYGVFAYAWAWLYMLALPAGFGLAAACVRFIAEYVALDDWPKVRGMIGRSVALTFTTGVVIAGLVVLAVLFVPSLVKPDFRIALVLAAIGLPLVALSGLGSQIGRAFGWVALAYGPSQVWWPALLVLVAGIMTATGSSMAATIMVPVSLALLAAVLAVQAIVYARRLRARLKSVAAEYDRPAWMRVALPMLLIDSFVALISYADIVMVGIFLTPSDVAHYFAATRLAMVVSFFLTSVGSLAGPNLAALYAQGKTSDMQELLAGVTPWMTLPAAAVTLLLVVAGWPLLRLFGAGFDTAYVTLVLLAAGNLVASVNGPAGLVLNMTGHQGSCGKTYAGAAVTNIILNALLIPRLGIAGAALATTLTIIVTSGLLVFLVRRHLGLRSSIFGVLRLQRVSSPR
jgi:O-antigen/teichoic acid export membrane protein